MTTMKFTDLQKTVTVAIRKGARDRILPLRKQHENLMSNSNRPNLRIDASSGANSFEFEKLALPVFQNGVCVDFRPHQLEIQPNRVDAYGGSSSRDGVSERNSGSWDYISCRPDQARKKCHSGEPGLPSETAKIDLDV